MKLRNPYMHFGLLIFILFFVIVMSSPDTAVADLQLLNNNLPTSELDTNEGLITARGNNPQWDAAPLPWSLARMEAAQAYPLPEMDSLPGLSVNMMQSGSEPVYIPSVPPEESQVDEFSGVESTNQSVQSVEGYDYPAPYTRYENFDSYQVFPYSTIGVLFFSQRGVDRRCSAAVVGKNALWTAGHCVHDSSGEPEGWSENLVFIPAYKDGETPYGIWTSNDIATKSAWYSSGDLRYDMGGVFLNPNASFQSIQEVVGTLGFAYNLNPIQHWFNFGYPSLSPFDGKTMQICSGSFAYEDISKQNPSPIAMGCDMKGGSSGGAWIINFNGSTSGNYINGNNSFRTNNRPEEIYSPYFGDAAKDLFNFIAIEATVHLPIIISSDNQ